MCSKFWERIGIIFLVLKMYKNMSSHNFADLMMDVDICGVRMMAKK